MAEPTHFFPGLHDNYTPGLKNEPRATEYAMPSLFASSGLDMGVITQTSPNYEMEEDDEKVQLAVDVHGFNASEIEIHTEDHGHVLHLTEKSSDGKRKIEKSFFLDANVDTEHISAEFKEGVLLVTVPKMHDGPSIAITEYNVV